MAGKKRRHPGPRSSGALQEALDETARTKIRQALRSTSGNVLRAAELLGLSRQSLRLRMGRLGISADDYRE
jgi:DNA-binding NtrC family response regulator